MKEPPERSPQAAPSQRISADETILLVEDEDPVREVNTLLLESLGYRVLQVSDAEEALKLGQNKQAEDRPLVYRCDDARNERPGIGRGIPCPAPEHQDTFPERIYRRYRGSRRVLQTEVPFLQKPFSIETLAKKIRNLFDQK